MAGTERFGVDDELWRIARGDLVRHRLLRDSLGRLANGAGGPELQEMARGVLAGRVTLRRAMLSGVYSEALWPQVQRFLRRRDELRDGARTGKTFDQDLRRY